MSDTRIKFCQYPETACDGCADKERCDYKRTNKSEPTTRTCPECGYVNGRDDWNCARCDHPIRWK